MVVDRLEEFCSTVMSLCVKVHDTGQCVDVVRQCVWGGLDLDIIASWTLIHIFVNKSRLVFVLCVGGLSWNRVGMCTTISRCGHLWNVMMLGLYAVFYSCLFLLLYVGYVVIVNKASSIVPLFKTPVMFVSLS